MHHSHPHNIPIKLHTQPVSYKCVKQMCHAGTGQLTQQNTVHCHVFQYHELQAATADFNNDRVVGEGGFGRVYKGQLANGSVAAVKRLDRHGLQV